MSTALLYHMCNIRGYRQRSMKYVSGGVEIAIEQPRERIVCPNCQSTNIILKGGKTRRCFPPTPRRSKRPCPARSSCSIDSIRSSCSTQRRPRCAVVSIGQCRIKKQSLHGCRDPLHWSAQTGHLFFGRGTETALRDEDALRLHWHPLNASGRLVTDFRKILDHDDDEANRMLSRPIQNPWRV